ncbi:MAG TPA: methylglyoxal synthase [Vicinamibacteria bacterium]|nr:methylglyoxal synthase [Vicinamibacteria bacterium]
MTTETAPATKRVALIAHDHCKRDLVEWVVAHREVLRAHRLLATGTTARVVTEATGLPVEALLSGPLGGDQQVGARIATGEVDLLVFFWDPLAAQPHDPDVRALLRLAVMWNLPTASNRATADFLVSSPHFAQAYARRPPALARAAFGPERPLPGF